MARTRRNKIQTLYESFAGSPRASSAVPFLVLNDDMDPAITGGIIEDLSKKGFAGAVLCPGIGLSVPVASDEYWKRLSAVIKRANALSMSVWLCVDYHLPIDAPDAGPDLAAQGLVFRSGKCPRDHERVIGTYLTRGRSIAYLADRPAARKCIVASVAPTELGPLPHSVAASLPQDGTGCLDILNRDAAGHYIRTVLEPLRARLGGYFENNIAGILIRSPQNECPFPWTGRLPDLFKQKFGYDLVATLPSLTRDVGDWISVRADYYRLIGDLTGDFYRAVGLWARQHNLSFSATVGREGFVECLAHTQGDPYTVLTGMSIPATSYRCNGTHNLGDTSPLLPANFTPKFASSVARIGKDDRTIASVWHAEGWSVTPGLLKRTIDCGLSLGITAFFTHAVFSSIVGMRKRDFPPSLYLPLPYWEDIGLMADYISRTCLMMSAGHSRVDTLVLFPLTSLWVNTVGIGRLTKEGRRIVGGLTTVMSRLLCDQRDFDLLHEEMVKQGVARCGQGAISVGPNRYSTLIIPYTTHMPGSVLSFIEAAKKAGVTVVFVGGLPSVIDGEQSPIAPVGTTLVTDADDLIHYLGLNIPKALTVFGDHSDKFVHQRRSLPGADVYFVSYLGDERFTGRIALAGTGNAEAWDPENGRRYIISEFRVTEDGMSFPVTFEPGKSWIYVIHSEYTDAPNGFPAAAGHRAGEFFFPGRWTIDRRSDNMFRIDNFRLIRSLPTVSFPPLRDLFRDRRFGLAAKIMIASVRLLAESIGRVWGARRKIAYRSFTSMDREAGLYLRAARLARLTVDGQTHYRKIDLIQHASRYMGLFLSTPLPPECSEFEIEANFIVGHIPGRIALVWEDNGQSTEIYVNGVLVSDRSDPCFIWDRHNRRADLSNIIRWGTNRIGIRSRQSSAPTAFPAIHWIEPVVITGDFDVNMDIIIPRKETTRHLSWGKTATGNYSGTISYTTRFNLPKRFAGHTAILDLGDVRVASRLVLNGRDLGARLWPPHRYDVTEALVAGENDIEISVTSGAGNLLGTPAPSGIMTDPKIVFYNPR